MYNRNAFHDYMRVFKSQQQTGFRNIDSLCKTISEQQAGLDYLILSQGVASMNGFTATAEGIDRKLAVHYYGRMACINNLLPLLQQSNGKVLSVLSAGVHSPYTNRNDLSLKTNFSIKNAADAAGFYNDLTLDTISRQNPGISLHHAAPGFVSTNWGSEFHPILKAILSVY